MADELLKKLLEDLIDKDKWANILNRFIDVLRINIFIVDFEGKVVLPPRKGPSQRLAYGADFVVNTMIKTAFGENSITFLSKFAKNGEYLEYKDSYGFHTFAVPIVVANDKTIAYLIMGPVILNKRLEMSEYLKIVKEQNMNEDEFLGSINEIGVVSFIKLNSILDLLSVIVKDIMDFSFEKRSLSKMQQIPDVLPDQVSEMAKDMFASIHLDAMLATLLDVALNLTNTECGSIMVIDYEKGEMTIKVSRGIDEKIVQAARTKIGEGIAGIAAKENSPFVISGTQGSNRIKSFLKRPEIKKSVVIPIATKNKVFGVLSLHTKQDDDRIQESFENLQNLSKLISAAFVSL